MSDENKPEEVSLLSANEHEGMTAPQKPEYLLDKEDVEYAEISDTEDGSTLFFGYRGVDVKVWNVRVGHWKTEINTINNHELTPRNHVEMHTLLCNTPMNYAYLENASLSTDYDYPRAEEEVTAQFTFSVQSNFQPTFEATHWIDNAIEQLQKQRKDVKDMQDQLESQ